MEWQDLGTFTLNNNWHYTSQIKGRNFKITYFSPPILGLNSTGIIALANMPEDPTNDSTEFFKPQRTNSYLPSEIITFPEPLKGWDYRLAIKKLVLPNKLSPDPTIQIFMPVVDLNPDQPEKPLVNPAIATAKNTKLAVVGPEAFTAQQLLPVNATNVRKHATFHNHSPNRNLYIDTDSNINTVSAIAKVGPGKVYVSDIPGWQGEYWGMLDGTGSMGEMIDIEEYV